MNNFWKNKKVLVTGAAGFVGSHAVDALVGKGANVIAVVSPKTTKERIRLMLGKSLSKVALKKADLLNFSDCIDITKGIDVVLNFAAMDGGAAFKTKYPALIFKTNVGIVLNILDACSQNKVDRLLLMSSIDVYPKNVHEQAKESYELKENFQNEINGYVWSKRFSEIAAKMYIKEYGLKVAIVRAGNIYGPRDYLSGDRIRVVPSFISKAIAGEDITILGSKRDKKQFLYITDFLQSALNLVEKKTDGDVVNIASERTISLKDLAELVVHLAKSKSKVKMAQVSSQSSPRLISVLKAKKIIGFKERVILEKGIQYTLEYVKENI